MLLTIYQIKIAATKRPTKITNTNLLFCLSQLCWFLDCSFSFEFQPVPCTVGIAFALVAVVDRESETVNDGVMLEIAKGNEEDEREEEEGSNVDEMLPLLIKLSLVVVVVVAVALLVSVALLVVCANTMVIKYANNIIKKCFDKLIVQKLKKLNNVLYKIQI